MQNVTNILILEHDPNDLELLQYELKRSGLIYKAQIVQTKEEFENAISNFQPDVILSDYSLPKFNGLAAFQIKERLSPGTPFIFVSGTIGDENAVELIKSGATDYTLKEKMYQLPIKIQRALLESEKQRQKIIAEQKLEQTMLELQRIMDLSVDLICIIDHEGFFVNISNSSQEILGLKPIEIIGQKKWDFIHPDDLKETIETLSKVLSSGSLLNFENRYKRKDGKYTPLIWSIRLDADTNLLYCVGKDATEIKEKEASLKYSESRLKEAQVLGQMGNWEINFIDGSTFWSDELYHQYCLDKYKFQPSIEAFISLIHPEDQPAVAQGVKEAMTSYEDGILNFRFIRPDGEIRYAYTKWHFEFDKTGKPSTLIGVQQDITESKLAKLALEESEKNYHDLFHFSPAPMWIYDLNTLRFLDVNEAAIKNYGYSKQEFLEMSIKEIRPENDIRILEQVIEKRQKTGEVDQDYFRHKKKNGEIIIVNIKSSNLNFNGFIARIVLATDITERYKYLQAIEEQNRKLMEIAWIQGHKVRAPLARLMGLVSYLRNYNIKDEESLKMLNYIMISANELDDIIRLINNKAEPLLDLNNQAFTEDDILNPNVNL